MTTTTRRNSRALGSTTSRTSTAPSSLLLLRSSQKHRPNSITLLVMTTLFMCSEAFAALPTFGIHRGGAEPLAASTIRNNNHNHWPEGEPHHNGALAKVEETVEYVADTRLPTDIGQFRLRAYRVPNARSKMTSEPCVIYASGKLPQGSSVPVRIHDQCLTSEVFRSQRCDCKEQLQMALKMIHEEGGMIIYLQQEGRGIGLANKVAAYSLQDLGYDTVDANLHLGLPEDARTYGVVPSILNDMGIDSIRLMTNNPRKVDMLTEHGVMVEGTIPVVVPTANQYNRRYLESKVQRMNHRNLGHILDKNHQMPMRMRAKMYIADQYINNGTDLTANAVHVSLLEEGDPENENLMSPDILDDSDDDDGQAGVVAAEDGYCFGRQSVEDALAAMTRGEMVVVVDDLSRENEGDFIMAADHCTPERMAEIIRYSSGVICLALTDERMKELQIDPMVENNEDPKETAFGVSVDATAAHGITTGISAVDRSKTVRLLGSADARASDFHRPGHIFPLRARQGGVLTRDGHTEAAIDMSVLAGCSPAGVLCEIVSEDNPVEMMRLPEMKRFCKKHGYVLTSIADLIQYRKDTEESAASSSASASSS